MDRLRFKQISRNCKAGRIKRKRKLGIGSLTDIQIPPHKAFIIALILCIAHFIALKPSKAQSQFSVNTDTVDSITYTDTVVVSNRCYSIETFTFVCGRSGCADIRKSFQKMQDLIVEITWLGLLKHDNYQVLKYTMEGIDSVRQVWDQRQTALNKQYSDEIEGLYSLRHTCTPYFYQTGEIKVREVHSHGKKDPLPFNCRFSKITKGDP